jgi:hypothetical protein
MSGCDYRPMYDRIAHQFAYDKLKDEIGMEEVYLSDEETA